MCQHVQHVYHGFLIYYKYGRTIYDSFLGFKTTKKKYHLVQWYQASCCKVAFSQRDFQQCVIKRSSLERRYYVPAELTDLLYVNTKDIIKIRTISIRVVSLHFVSFRYQSILVGGPLTSYINIYSFIYYIYIYNIYIYIHSFIIPKTSHNSYHFCFGWLLSQNLGNLGVQTEKKWKLRT